MPIIKDGNEYRTEYEQLVHLTEKHLEQVNINKNVNRQLQDLSVASNLGGYNYVRFAFEKQGTYFKIAEELIDNPFEQSEIGDYFELSSNTDVDIPAYGYLTVNNKISIAFSGDFITDYRYLTIRNVTKNLESDISLSYSEFEGTGLLDYNPQEKAKQLFNVLDDLAYNGKTQYASYDLNNDGIYNYVFIGVNKDGENGFSVYTVNEDNYLDIIQKMVSGDSLISTFIGNIANQEVGIGDILKKITVDDFEKIGNIRGLQGAKGEQGEQGEQGIQGVQGKQGIQGIQGIQGESGKNAPVLNLISYLDNNGLLPAFADAQNGDAYCILNTSGATISYDLYFKGSGYDNWQIVPNWGPLEGKTGPQGPIGPQGIQGVQGPQGPRGLSAPLYNHSITLNYIRSGKIDCRVVFNFIDDSSSSITKSNIFNRILNKALDKNKGITFVSNGWYLNNAGVFSFLENVTFRENSSLGNQLSFAYRSSSYSDEIKINFRVISVENLSSTENITVASSYYRIV